MRQMTIALFLSLAVAAAFAAPKVAKYDSEDAAQTHCPYDVVVWLNPRARHWYTRKSRHYANDRYGGFVCKEEAVKAGYKKGK